jgi:hypothetical protein
MVHKILNVIVNTPINCMIPVKRTVNLVLAKLSGPIGHALVGKNLTNIRLSPKLKK